MSYDPAFWSRLQFAFMLTYHYLFPQLTMGLTTVYFVFIPRRYVEKSASSRTPKVFIRGFNA